MSGGCYDRGADRAEKAEAERDAARAECRALRERLHVADIAIEALAEAALGWETSARESVVTEARDALDAYRRAAEQRAATADGAGEARQP